MSARDPDRLWSSRHSGASSIRGTLYMLGFGALWALVYVLTGWLVGMILGTLSVFNPAKPSWRATSAPRGSP